MIESFTSQEETKEMRDRMAVLLQEFDGGTSSVFSTKDHVVSYPLQYFLSIFLYIFFQINFPL